jgi:mannitol-1-/sugar-/sorbitol-6-/2-deoxyglucose-6-phosphatase
MIEAVIFDMDGLLIDSEPYWQAVEHEVFAGLGIEITPEMHVETYGLGLNEVIKHWYRYKPWNGVSEKEIKETIVKKVTDSIKKDGEALPGTEQLISFFKKQNIPLALASASPVSMIEAVIEKLALQNVFQLVHSCENEQYEKPHPAVYLSVAGHFDVAPARCLVFEDSLVGLIAAKAARMQVVAVPDKKYYQDPRFSLADIKLRSLTEFSQKDWMQFNNVETDYV